MWISLLSVLAPLNFFFSLDFSSDDYAVKAKPVQPHEQGIALSGPENRPMTQNRAEQLWWASGCKHCRRWCERYDTPSARLRVTVRAKLVRFHTFIRLRESPRQWHSSCANDDSCHGADLARSKRLVYTLARSGLGYGINAF